MFAALAGQASSVGQQLFLAAWSADPRYARLPLAGYVGGLLGFAALVAGAAWARSLVGVHVQLRSGEAIHQSLAAAVLAAPLGFFESTPVSYSFSRPLVPLYI